MIKQQPELGEMMMRYDNTSMVGSDDDDDDEWRWQRWQEWVWLDVSSCLLPFGYISAPLLVHLLVSHFFLEQNGWILNNLLTQLFLSVCLSLIITDAAVASISITPSCCHPSTSTFALRRCPWAAAGAIVHRRYRLLPSLHLAAIHLLFFC